MYLSPDAVWVLKSVQPAQVRRVITYGGLVPSLARQMGIEVLSGDANKLEFDPSSVGLSVRYPFRIGPSLLSRYRSIYNLHPGYLPWCRGLSSVNWAIWEGSPAGATLHEMTGELDAGPIIDGVEVEYGPDDLCGEVQERVSEAERRLFQRYWPRIANGENLPARPQGEAGSSHTRQETARFLRRLKKEAHWQSMEGRELITALRAFGPLELEHGNRVLRLSLAATKPPVSGRRGE